MVMGRVEDCYGVQQQEPVVLPKGLSYSIASQIDDLHQVVTGAGEQLGPIVIQVQ